MRHVVRLGQNLHSMKHHREHHAELRCMQVGKFVSLHDLAVLTFPFTTASIIVFSQIVFFTLLSSFFLLFLFPLPQRPAEMPTVELHAILVEYAEDRAAAAETADRPDVVDGVTAVVHRDDGAFALLFRLGSFLRHLYTTVQSHPLPVIGQSVGMGSVVYVTCFCHCFCRFVGKLNSFRL